MDTYRHIKPQMRGRLTTFVVIRRSVVDVGHVFVGQIHYVTIHFYINGWKRRIRSGTVVTETRTDIEDRAVFRADDSVFSRDYAD